MGDVGILFALAFAPGFFWLWRVYRRNRNRPDHKGLVLRTFLLGAFSAIPIVLGKRVFFGPDYHPSISNLDASAAALVAFGDAGLFEEVGKFLVVRLSMYRSPYFDSRVRGLVYSAAAALGFASLENVEYVAMAGPGVMVLRSVLSTLGHVAFSGLWGYGLGFVRERGRATGSWPIFLGLIGAISLHGGYDYFLFRGGDQWRWAVLLFIAGIALFFLLLRRSAASPAAGRRANPVVGCPGCGKSHSLPTRFCDACGRRLGATLAELCGSCRAPLPPAASYCEGCGVRAEREQSLGGG